MVRLPTPGSDKNAWGEILNEFLAVEHNADGTLVKAGDIAKAATSVQSVNNITPVSGSLTLTASQVGAASQSALTALDSAAEKISLLGQTGHGMPSVSSRTILRALEPAVDGQLVYLSEYPREGTFRADLNDSAAADDDGRVFVTAGGKRWKRILPIGTTVCPEWWGARADDSTNSTAAFVAAIASLGQKGGVIRCSAGSYRVNGGQIILPALVIIEGAGGFSRFNSTYGNVLAATRLIRRLASDTADLVTVAGSGSGLRSIHLEGRTDSTGTVLVMQGFESVLDDVRVIASGGYGLDVQKANNTKWRNVYVDNCGSSTLPAVRIFSKSGVGEAADTNTLHIDGLTIERSNDRAMEIGVGPDVGEWRAEFITIHRLHIEPAGTGNTSSLIKIGNVRHLDFVSPFIFGGTGYVIEHDEQATHPYGSGGIRILGGTLLGTGTDIGTTPTLVRLRNGNDFSMIGTKCARHGSEAVVVDSTYGAKVFIDSSCSFDGPGAELTDGRSQRSQYVARGRFVAQGRISAAGGAPSIAWTSGITGTSILGGSNDVAGQVLFGTSASPPAAGVLATVTFNRTYTNQAIVMLTAASSTAQDLGLWVATSSTGFTIRARNAPLSSQSAGSYQIQYHVLGLGD